MEFLSNSDTVIDKVKERLHENAAVAGSDGDLEISESV